MTDLVESVLKAYRVLRVFGPDAKTLTVREISARSGIPRSTCHALCTTLAHVGMLEPMPGGGYQLGSAQAWLGAQVFERVGLVDAARAQLDQLYRAGSLSVSVSQYVERGWIVFLDRVGHVPVGRVGRLGTRVPAYACVEGQVVLSSMSESRCAEILAPADESQLGVDGVPESARAALESRLARARQQGSLVADHARMELCTVACPILDPTGNGVGALSLLVRRPSLTPRKLTEITERLQEAATAVSARAFSAV